MNSSVCQVLLLPVLNFYDEYPEANSSIWPVWLLEHDWTSRCGSNSVLSAGCFPAWLPKLCDGALESDHGGFIDVQTELKFINGVGIEKEEIVVCFLLLLYCWSSSDVWWRGHLAPFVWRICGRVQLGRGELKSQSSI